jgi:hypothetical protein
VTSVNGGLATALKAVVFDPPNGGAMNVTAKLWLREARTARPLGTPTITLNGAFDASSDPDVRYSVPLGGDVAGGAGGPGHGIGSRAVAPTISLGQITAQGDLDKAIVRRYIKRNLQRVLYCYEKQVRTTPAIAGTVETKFSIDGAGKVTSATSSGVHAAVASCITDVIQSVEFPKPKGGDVVQVSCPFVFRSMVDAEAR